LHLLLVEIVDADLLLPLSEDLFLLLLSCRHLTLDANSELVKFAFIPVGCLLRRSLVELVVIIHCGVFLAEEVSIGVVVISMLLLLFLEVMVAS
jgi:hypothetical protein